MVATASTILPADYEQRKGDFLKSNHGNYLKIPMLVGFIEPFPEVEDGVIDEMTITAKCRGFDVQFKVRYGRVSFGDDNKYTCDAITTDQVEIADKLPLGGFNSNCYHDEGETMELAVVEMAKKHGLMICDKICSWPHAKAIVSGVSRAHVLNHELKN